jgi:hypothetical protein
VPRRPRGIDVQEVTRPDRARRRVRGKSDPLDAYPGRAHAVLSGRADTAAKGRAASPGRNVDETAPRPSVTTVGNWVRLHPTLLDATVRPHGCAAPGWGAT